MLETLVAAVNSVQTIIYYGLYYSYNTGKFLVTSLFLLTEKIGLCLRNVFTLFGLLRESLIVFLQDILHGVLILRGIVYHILDTISRGFLTCVSNVCDAICSVYMAVIAIQEAISLIFTSVFACLGYCLVFIKKLFVLFGGGVYFAITLVPLSIFYLFTICVWFIRKLVHETNDIILISMRTLVQYVKDGFNFLTDIPVESFFGLVIAGSFVYIFVKFYMLLFSHVTPYLYQRGRYVKQKVQFILRRFSTVHQSEEIEEPVAQSEERIISPLQRRGAIRRRDEARRPNETCVNYDLPEHRCCVICQERLKCIVLLPCKHLCLCATCVSKLKRYNDKCPVCRNTIEEEMRIYI